MKVRAINTLDTGTRRPGLTNYNFYRTIFDILFVPAYKGIQVKEYHFMPDEDEGVLLLSQLYKNLLILSLLRHEKLDVIDNDTSALFDALAVGSIREAQWIALELLATRIRDLKQQRELALKIMDYCASGGVSRIKPSGSEGFLDGFILDKFAVADGEAQRRNLKELYNDSEKMMSVTIAFVATFSCFLNDPAFYIEGMDRAGVREV